MAQTILFDLSKRKGCNLADGTPIASFKMRETDGRDEENAANAAKAKGGSMTALEEQIRLSLVEVNGAKVNAGTPYLAYDDWNTRARQFAFEAYRSINMVKTEEVTDFLAGAVACE
jgi:hypothetical protein